jgi:hypothetical protein
MSYVTNLILNFGTLEEHEDRLREVNSFFYKDDKAGFVLMDSEGTPQNWYGGSKVMECWIAMGAFNYIDLDEFKNHLKNVKWNSPEYMQLIIKDQDDDKWSIWELF